MKNEEFEKLEHKVKDLLDFFKGKGVFFRLLNHGNMPILKAVTFSDSINQHIAEQTAGFISAAIKRAKNLRPLLLQVNVFCSTSFKEKDTLVNYYPFEWCDDLNIPIELKSRLKEGIDVTVVKHATVVLKKQITAKSIK